MRKRPTCDDSPDGCPAGALLEEPPAEDVPILPEDVQQQVQPEAAHPQHAHGGPGARLRDLPEEGEEQVVSEETPCHPPRRAAQEVKIRREFFHRSGLDLFYRNVLYLCPSFPATNPSLFRETECQQAISPVPTTQSTCPVMQ